MRVDKFVDRSDFVKPVIVWESSGSFLSSENTHDIKHNLPFVPLLLGEYSLNADFSEARAFSFWLNKDENFFVGALEGVVRMAIRFREIVDPPTRKVYYRMVGLVPPDYKGEVVPLKPRAMFDSRKKSLKLISFGKFSKGDIIRHNLGYLPVVYFWAETVIFRSGASSFDQMEACLRPSLPGARVSKDKIDMSNSWANNGYYMIFGDRLDE